LIYFGANLSYLTVNKISDSELIVKPDGSVYHLGLRPEEVGEIVVTVGDPERVSAVSAHFDHILFKRSVREFTSHTGELEGKRITVISTGIGTDNIDIVLNELDALVNVDFTERRVKEEHVALDIIRLGTTGLVQPGASIDQLYVSDMAVDGSGWADWYQYEMSTSESALANAVEDALLPGKDMACFSANRELLERFSEKTVRGNAFTAAGFYGPQGRAIRTSKRVDDFLNKLASVDSPSGKITNIEMETAGIYGLSALLGHRAIAINAALANRSDGTFSTQPNRIVESMIEHALQVIVSL